MDDAFLRQLVPSVGTLTPTFSEMNMEYNLTVPSDVDQVKFNCEPRDNGASYQIKGADGRSVALKEGALVKVNIEVTSEDGNGLQIYLVRLKRLSAKDATLSKLGLSDSIVLDEVFQPDKLEYSCEVPYNLAKIEVLAETNDKKVTFTGGGAVKLNFGLTIAEIRVTSPDKSNTAVYLISISRARLPLYVRMPDTKSGQALSCPVCLNPIHNPVVVKDSQPRHVFCSTCVDMITRTAKVDPLNNRPLPSHWRLADPLSEELVSNELGECRWCRDRFPVSAIGAHLSKCISSLNDPTSEEHYTCAKCGQKIRKVEQSYHDKQLCSSLFTTSVTEIKHSYICKKWEERLATIHNESDYNMLLATASNYFEDYKESLNNSFPVTSGNPQKSLELLKTAMSCLASGIKRNPKKAEGHFKLGQLFEELYTAQDVYNLVPSESKFTNAANNEAEASGMEDEINGICQKHGCPANSALVDKLIAIDKEYKLLKQQGNSSNADYVQTLYAWKSKQSTADNRLASVTSTEDTPLGKAAVKYMDALSIEPNNALYNYEVGKMQMLRADSAEACRRLRVAVGSEASLWPAQFLLGAALAKLGSDPEVARGFLVDGFRHFREENLKRNNKSIQPSLDITQLRGLMSLAEIVVESGTEMELAVDVIGNLALCLSLRLASIAKRGETYKQLMWLLMKTHALYLEKCCTKNHEATFSGNLSSLISCSQLSADEEVVNLRETICQISVASNPGDTVNLAMLGDTQLAKYDLNPSKYDSSLEDAFGSFTASLQLEEKPNGGEVPELIGRQSWFKSRKGSEAGSASEAKSVPTKTASPVAKGKPQAKPQKVQNPVKTPVKTPNKRPVPVKQPPGRVASKPVAVSNVSTSRTTISKNPGAKAPVGKSSGQQAKKPEPVDEVVPVIQKTETEPVLELKINQKCVMNRLGLARCNARRNKLKEAKIYFDEVITMEPEMHDAYIEAGELLTKDDPLGAVNIYCKYPFKAIESFDNAFLHGEIVRLLMKKEEFDDPRLGPHMIEWGKVYGLSILEKYVNILDERFKSKLLMRVYAGVNGKSVDDEDMKTFFKFKCWI